jgi:hypothetical protein
MREVTIPQSLKDQYIGAVLGGQSRIVIRGIEISWRAIPNKGEIGEREREKLALKMAERDLSIAFG